MKKIAFAFLAVLAVLSFTGCKKKAGMAEAMAKMESFKNDACKCADKACLDKVDQAMAEWSKSMMEKQGDKPPQQSPEDSKKMAAIMEEMGKCRTKLLTPTDGAGTPPADGSAAAPPAADGSAAAAPPAADGSAAAPAAADGSAAAGGTMPAGSAAAGSAADNAAK
jgi:hypothetical protein